MNKETAKYMDVEWDLGERMNRLPKEIYDKIYRTLIYSYGMSRQRWAYLLEGKLTKGIYHYELAVICEELECTIFEVMNPLEDLLDIYLRKRQKQEDALAAEFKLSQTQK